MLPITCEDYRGCLKTAVQDPDPVVVLENKVLYNVVFPVSDEVIHKNFIVSISKAQIEKLGQHITLIWIWSSYSVYTESS